MIDFKLFREYPEISLEEIENEINQIVKKDSEQYNNEDTLKLIISLIDLTTLEGSDTEEKVIKLAQKGISYNQLISNCSNVAAICVYPPFVRTVKSILKGTNTKVASVAGAFPSGQSHISIKLQEIKYAIEEGADEIDMVISRGKLLENKYEEVYEEIVKIRELCKNITLKVILETGELQTLRNIKIASELAIHAGADFIKTSTGKISIGATYPAVYVMLQSIKNYNLTTNKKVGIKPSGGISDIETAINYLILTDKILGKDWLNKNLFRFGASRLADVVYNKLTNSNLSSQNLENY